VHLNVLEFGVTSIFAEVNKCANDGWYPLHMAASDGNTDIIKLLIKHKAKLNQQMSDGMTPLYLACNFGHCNVVKLLLDNKADVNKCENNGCHHYL
ncbi:ankyrin repeat domain-containing protein 49-like, partial [Mytilus californianus]|uniref:ankyrin repeat domain-containing protein 49-like n=1 Tax=Mytilus californianus TaxID=6549 RepID=UPI0022471282